MTIDKSAVAVGDSLAWTTRKPHQTTAYGRVIELADAAHPDAVRVIMDMGHGKGRYWIPWERVTRHEQGRALADSRIMP